MKYFYKALSVVFVILMIFPIIPSKKPLSAGAAYSAAENEQAIYDFCIDVLGVNKAAACGIVANIKAESTFNPTASYTEADGSLSYGICQWNKSRLENLKAYCEKNGYDYNELTGQLYFLKYELEGTELSAYNKVRNVSNTYAGAYEAGYNWARYFERCSSSSYETRAISARDVYWPKYGGDYPPSPSSMSFNEYNYPTSVIKGKSFSLKGYISSNSKINWVYAALLDADSNPVQSVSAEPDDFFYSIKNMDADLKFGKLVPGHYYYYIEAKDESNVLTVLIKQPFTVVLADHTCSYVTEYEEAHPHREYCKCYECGDYYYTGNTQTVSTCVDCIAETTVYTVSYNPCGGTGEPVSQEKKQGTDITLSDTLPIREGYIFKNWNTMADGSGTEYAPGAVYSEDADLTLYAQWEKEFVFSDNVYVFKVDDENIYYSGLDVKFSSGIPATIGADNKTVAPLRSIVTATGVNDLKYDGKTKKITFTGYEGYAVEMTVGSTVCILTKGGDSQEITIGAPVTVNSTTLLPLRDVTNLVGGTVKYDNGYIVVSKDSIDDEDVKNYIAAYDAK